MKPALALLAAALALWAPGGVAQSIPPDPGGVPKHLAIARELVEHTRPEHNLYKLGSQFIRFPGDDGGRQQVHQVRADCSGFLLAIFQRAGYVTRAQMAYLPDGRQRRKRPAAEDFVHSIESEQGFRRIRDARDIRPGDLLAHAMLDPADKRQAGTTGHVFLLDSAPKAIAPRNPVVAGTTQFEVVVIDSNEEHVGADDTRLADPANKVKGLGRGTIRLYLDADGVLVGWARTFPGVKRFFSYDPRFPSDTRRRKAAVGRPVTEG